MNAQNSENANIREQSQQPTNHKINNKRSISALKSNFSGSLKVSSQAIKEARHSTSLVSKELSPANINLQTSGMK